MPLKTYFRHLQSFKEDGSPYIYTGANPASIAVQSGTVPQTTWIDVTQEVDGLESLKINWRKRDSDKGNIETGITAELTLYDNAFQFVKAWLNDHVAAPLNAVDVKIEDVGCVTYDGFVIKADGMKWCNDTTCHIEITLKQQDEQYDCIRKTSITDNWQGWFHSETTKQHPRINYCDELRPAGILSVIFMIIATLSIVFYIFAVVVFPLCIIVALIPFTSLTPGDCVSVFSTVKRLYDALAGCGRVHPSPLIRDYISNVCKKCGVEANAASIPIYFDPASPYYNEVYLNAEVKKGIPKDENRWWIPENDPLLTLDMLLDKLKKHKNAEWRLLNGILYFNRRDKYISPDVVFDITAGDKDQLISNVCYEWNGDKKPAYLKGIYQKDAIEVAGNQVLHRMNDHVEFNVPNNPMLEGEKNIVGEFAGTQFMWDGADTNYLHDAMKPALIFITIAAPVGLIDFLSAKNRYKDARGFLLMRTDTASLPKLIIWDGGDARNARAAWQYEYNGPMPAPNSFYGTDSYQQRHPEDYDNFFDLRGRLYNYPNYFDAQFKGNLYENQWQIEDPRLNPPMNKDWEILLLNCCDNLKRLGLQNGAAGIKIGSKVRLYDKGFYTIGTLESVEVDYDTGGKSGKSIKLSGKL